MLGVLFPFLLMLLPTLFASFYASYRDIFGVTDDPQGGAAVSSRREIPYNYTSFSDREIVIRLLGEEAWDAARRAARAAPHRPLGAHALRGAGRHLGRSSAIPTSRTTCSTHPQAPRRADRRACATGCDAIEARRSDAATSA